MLYVKPVCTMNQMMLWVLGRQVQVVVRQAMLTDLLNEITDFLHPLAIGLHNHELVLGPFPLLAHLRAATDQQI